MALAKLTIKPLPPSKLASKYPKGFEVQFNPNTYSIVKPVSWTPTSAKTNREANAPSLSFGGGGARTLSLNLFFDVTEGGPDADVRSETNKIVQLTLIERDLKKPPTVVVTWGKKYPDSDFPFVGVATNLTQAFNLFSSAGAPLRANLTLALTEHIDAVRDKKQTDPDFSTYQVKLGDTLSSIAAKVYHDPARWRWIAAVNRIDDPRRLTPGVRLAIPKLG